MNESLAGSFVARNEWVSFVPRDSFVPQHKAHFMTRDSLTKFVSWQETHSFHDTKLISCNARVCCLKTTDFVSWQDTPSFHDTRLISCNASVSYLKRHFVSWQDTPSLHDTTPPHYTTRSSFHVTNKSLVGSFVACMNFSCNKWVSCLACGWVSCLKTRDVVS